MSTLQEPVTGEIDVTEPAEEEPASAPRDLTPWKEALKWVVITRVVFFAVAGATAQFLAAGEGAQPPSFETMWSRWDASLFYLVAEHGYTGSGTDPHATAFFPLFPMLLKLVGAAGFSYTIAGLLINSAACVVAFAYLYRWVNEELGEEAAGNSIVYLALFPTAVFLVAPYSEALFLAGAIPAFYYARQERWHLAALPAAVATSARFAGLFLVIGLAAEFLRRRRFTLESSLNAGAALVAGMLPALFYFAYLARAKGSFFYYFTDQREGWHREFTLPWVSFQRTWETFQGAGYTPNWVIAWRIEIVAALVGVAVVAWAAWKREWGYAAYMGVFLATLMTSTWFFSIPRMMVGFFPIALLLAAYAKGRRRVHELILVTSGALAIMGVIVYTSGSWFF